MIFDLKGDSEMDSAVGTLYSMVEGNYKRLKAIVHGMSQEELDYKGPEKNYNSTAQLLKHLAYVDLNWVFRIKDEILPSVLEEQFGPMLDEKNKLPIINGISLNELLKNYDDVVNMLKAFCLELTDKQLNHIVDYENGNKATIRWGIWHIADHSRYHQAHINQLRYWFSQYYTP
jgi:uncharacterized damage-inducible protein DinB